MKHLTIILIGYSAFMTFVNLTPRAEGATETMVIEYQTDVCYSDDIGLVRLKQKDVERLVR